MLNRLGHKIKAAFILTVVAVIASGCSNSVGDASSSNAATQEGESSFHISSPNFSEIRPKTRIPHQHACYGENTSPPLSWSGSPDGTKSFALIVDEPEHALGSWAHWVLYNIPPGASELVQGIPTTTAELPDGTKQGTNDYETPGYSGPCPRPVPNLYGSWDNLAPGAKPPGPTEYKFTLYALDNVVNLGVGSTRNELDKAMSGHILAKTDAYGKYLFKEKVEGKTRNQ